MRKHTLIAVTAFTALGLSAIAGARSGTPELMNGRGPSVGPSRFALLAKTAAQNQPPPSERVPMGTPWLRGRDEIVLHDIDAQLVVDFIDIKWRP
ncbi:MAG: hypothetical protein ACRDZ5_11800, partial [Acidimicrobiales bacterium]